MKLKCTLTFPKERKLKMSSVTASSPNTKISGEVYSTPFHLTSTCLDIILTTELPPQLWPIENCRTETEGNKEGIKHRTLFSFLWYNLLNKVARMTETFHENMLYMSILKICLHLK